MHASCLRRSPSPIVQTHENGTNNNGNENDVEIISINDDIDDTQVVGTCVRIGRDK